MDSLDYIDRYPVGRKLIDAGTAEMILEDIDTLTAIAEIRRPIPDYSIYCPHCQTHYHASEYKHGCPVCGR
jgi:Zn finger protein HypA/HybF involved in hydrogenase expression